jgi:hypothetical protein
MVFNKIYNFKNVLNQKRKRKGRINFKLKIKKIKNL